MKQGAEGPIKGWKKRFFSSRNGNLFYFKGYPFGDDDENSDAIGLINLINCFFLSLN